ncbi:MAG: hypothetical protein R6U55_09620 [Desulfovermiculus sp.]
MKAISLRNVPEDVYAALQEMARENRRSLQEQVKYLLEQEVRLIRQSPTSRASAWRKKLGSRNCLDIPELIREDRNR